MGMEQCVVLLYTFFCWWLSEASAAADRLGIVREARALLPNSTTSMQTLMSSNSGAKWPRCSDCFSEKRKTSSLSVLAANCFKEGKEALDDDIEDVCVGVSAPESW